MGHAHGNIVTRYRLGSTSQQTSTGDPGGGVSIAASRRNELPAGGNLAGSPAETSKALAQSARETDESSSCDRRQRRVCRLSLGQEEHCGADNVTGFCYLSVLLPVRPSSRVCGDAGPGPLLSPGV